MPPTMTNYTYVFGDSGQVLNTDSLGMPFFDVTKVSGLDTAPLRTTTDERQGMDGTYVDSAHMSARTIVIEGNLYCDPNDPEGSGYLDQLRADYNSDVLRPFYFQHPGQSLRFANAKGAGCVYDIDTQRASGITAMQLAATVPDSYIYDYPALIGSTPFPAGVGVGIGFNMSFNTGFGGTVPNTTVMLTNNGTHTAYPVITLRDAMQNPVLVDGSGITMLLGISTVAGDVIVIDCLNKTITYNGVSKRQIYQGLLWFSVPAKSSSTINFGAASGSATGSVTLYSTYY